MPLLDAIIARGPDKALQGEAEVQVMAPPEQVYRLVTDIGRMGEWSPECYRCQWLDGADSPAVGARFKGFNRRGWLRWSTTCRVSDVDPGRVFAFEVTPGGSRVQSKWRYELEPRDGGTLLLESFQVLWYLRVVVLLLFGGARRRRDNLEMGVGRTLARLKSLAETENP